MAGWRPACCAAVKSKSWSNPFSEMRRETLEKLITARREGRPLVRAVNLKSGEERLLDPSAETSPLGRAAAAAAREDIGRRVTLDGEQWFLSVYALPREIVIVGAVHIAQAL